MLLQGVVVAGVVCRGGRGGMIGVWGRRWWEEMVGGEGLKGDWVMGRARRGAYYCI